MKRRVLKNVALTLCTALLTSAFGCGGANGDQAPELTPTPKIAENVKNAPTAEPKLTTSVNLMADVDAGKAEIAELTEEFLNAQNRFAVKLLQTQYKSGENTMISPVSAMLALAMTANGARGTTLSEMEKVLGSGIGIEELDKMLFSFVSSLDTNEKCKVHIADSVWFSDDADMIRVKEDFLKTNAKYFNSEIYKAPFDDTTLKDVNNWVNKNTDGMIPSILEKVKKEDVMYLINAISFDAEWKKPYDEAGVFDGTFTNAAGKKETVKMMASEEGTYLEDDTCKGFMKDYAGGYAFVALLPDEGVSIDEFVASLTEEKVMKLLNNRICTKVRTRMPSFETECSFTLNDGLKAMGMPTAFDGMAADFGNMAYDDGNGKICIDRVIQKTYIKVDEKGTKAGAATLVAMMKNTAFIIEEPKEVFLERPFVYMIIDTENFLPLFFGAECSVK